MEEDEVKSLEVGNLNGNESKANGKEAQSRKSKRKMYGSLTQIYQYSSMIELFEIKLKYYFTNFLLNL